MNIALHVVLTGGALIVGILAGVLWSKEWQHRFRYEAQHWNRVVEHWREAYYASHRNAHELRQEIVALHIKITKLTVTNCEVLEWVSRAAKKALDPNAQSSISSTMPLPGSGSTTSSPKES